MAFEKLNDKNLLRLIDKEKLSQAETARRLGVSRQRISQRLIELRGRTTRAVICKRIAEVVDDRIDTLGQLKKINVHANDLLDLLTRWTNGDPEALRVLESQVKRVVHGEGDQAEEIIEIKMKDPRELAIRCMSEIREQLALQVKIFESLYSLRQAEEFQREVLEVIAEVEPDVRRRILERINKRRALGPAVRWN